MVTRGDAKPLARALRKLMPALGAARDWDVFCAWLAGLEDRAQPEMRALLAAARRRRGAARRAARATVSSAAYQGFLLRALRWLHDAPWQRQAKFRDLPLAAFAARSLERLHRKVAQHGHGGHALSAAQRHALRIRIKRLRYACEFFAPCFARAVVKPFLKRLEVLQDILGELNDATVARRLLAGLAPRGSAAPLAAAAGRVRRALAARERALLRSLEPAWAAFEKRRPFWRPR
jgi:CHAD domain-containing protein